jgi:hypothetical protein
MRFMLASLVATFALIAGGGLAWWGLSVAYIAVDPDAYRDSSDSTYFVVGGALLAAGLTCMLGAIACIAWALEYRIPRWVVLAVLGAGMLPFAMLMGGVAIAVNVVLLGLAGLLAYMGRQQDRKGSWP